MDFMLALNVTIYGLGIVFLALLVLMFSIMVLTKLFSLATGKEVFSVAAPVQEQPVPAVQMAGAGAVAPAVPVTSAPAVAEAAPAPTAEVVEQVFAPLPGKVLSVAVKPGDKVRSGDELCIIEAMKMGNSIKAQQDGVVGEVLVSPGQSVAFGAPLVVIVREGTTGQVPRPVAAPAPPAPPAAAPAAATAVALAGFKMGIAGKQYQVDLKTAAGGSVVVVDGVSYRIERDKTDSKKVIVNGTPHTVDVKDRSAGSVFVVVDGVAQKIEISGEVYESPPKSFKMAIAGKQYQVEVNGSTVKVDGATYQVERDKADAQRFLVNGQPHTVEIKEMAGEAAIVVVDGTAQKIEVSGLSPAAAPAASPSAPAAAPAAPAPAAASAPPTAPAAGETVTAPLPGKILSVAVNIGDVVKQGDELCVIEAMKMGNSIKAQRAGTIKDVLVSPGQTVGFGAPLVVMG